MAITRKANRSGTSPKVVADPIYGIIDIRPVLGMVETEEFQILSDKRQLGMSYLTFPSATHSRKAHSLGAYHATRELADRWLKRGFLNATQADALAGYALYHDIGHPAFSHVTEDLCVQPKGTSGMSMNSALSFKFIQKLKTNIQACGIDFALLEKMAHRADPLAIAVSDKNLGMEKLDYLERDGFYTILSRPVGVDYLRQHIYFIDGKLAIDEKAVDNAIEVQNYYLKIYKNVYLRKTSAIAQRMMQKMTHCLILAEELFREELPLLTDSELIGRYNTSKDPFVRATYALLRRRDLFREAIVLRPEKFAYPAASSGKPVTTFGIKKIEMRRLAQNPKLQPRDQDGIAFVESSIAALAGLPAASVLITPIHGQERFAGQDILIYQGAHKKLASLKERYPAHFKNIEEVAESYVTFRICTTEKYRKVLSSPKIAKRVFEHLMG
jgi:HD superfamily phosphohydrolase